MTYICHQCKYTTEKLNATFAHEKRKEGHHMGLDFGKFLKDPKVLANIEKLKQKTEAEKAERLRKFKEDKIIYKHFLHQAIKGCDFNGAGMRELLQEFVDEVAGS